MNKLKLIFWLFLFFSTFALSDDSISKSSQPISIYTYHINGNTFQFYQKRSNILHKNINYRLYFISRDDHKQIFDMESSDKELYDEQQDGGINIGFDPDITGLSPDRKFINIELLEYGLGKSDDNNSQVEYHETFSCHIISTETGEEVYSGSGQDCDFKWDPVYSGLLLMYGESDYDQAFSLLPDGETNPKINYGNLDILLKQVTALYNNKNYAQIRTIAEKAVINTFNITNKNVTDLNNLGYYYSEAGAYTEAIQILSAINTQYRYRAVAILNLADTFFYMNNIERAKFYYKRYLSTMKYLDKLDKIPTRLLKIFNNQPIDKILKSD